jgi:hypothetical protein
MNRPRAVVYVAGATSRQLAAARANSPEEQVLAFLDENDQSQLIAECVLLGVFDVRPGITGLAQSTGIDVSTPQLLAETDVIMLKWINLQTYFRYIFKTVTGSGSRDRINRDLS